MMTGLSVQFTWVVVIRFRPLHLASVVELVCINIPFLKSLFPPVKMTVPIFRNAHLHLLLIWSRVLCTSSVNESDFFYNISDLIPGKNIPFHLREITGRSRSILIYLRGDFQFMLGGQQLICMSGVRPQMLTLSLTEQLMPFGHVFGLLEASG